MWIIFFYWLNQVIPFTIACDKNQVFQPVENVPIQNLKKKNVILYVTLIAISVFSNKCTCFQVNVKISHFYCTM